MDRARIAHDFPLVLTVLIAVFGSAVTVSQTHAQCTGCPNASFAGAPHLFEAGDRLNDIVSADFDGDGFLDAAVTRSFVGGPVLLFLGNGRGGFAEPLSFPTPEYPRSIVTGDFNRDGFPDLAFTFSNRPTIGVLIGGAGGRFGSAVEYAAGPEPWDLVAADFNGDHVDDLAVILNGSSGNAGVAILLATGTGAFGAPNTFPDGQYPRDVAAGDLNHDGKVDLAITNVNENVVSILLGQGDGSFGARTTFAAPPTVFSVAIGLFNGDSNPDLAVSGGGFFEPAALAILPGNGQGAFGAATVVAPISTRELGVLDFNRDGKEDLAAIGFGVTLLAGNGNGTFQAPLRHAAGFSPQAFAHGDFNSDGWTDFAVALDSSPGIRSLLLLLGDPSGLEKVPLYPGAFDPSAITVGDFNHDGRSDLAIADNSTRFYPAWSLSVLLSLPGGSFSPPATYLTVPIPMSIRTADFNGDGHLDLACASSSQISILLGTGTGAFSAATNYALGTFISGFDTADFNGDQKVDIVFSSYDGLTILFGDGTGSFGSPVNRSTDAVDSPPAAADLNLDGKMDVVMKGYRILYGDGTGHFGEVSYVDAGVSLQKFIVSDLNGDGRPDLAGIGVTEGGAVLLGQPTGGFGSPLPFPVEFDAYVRMAPTAADFDLDGKMDLAVLSGGSVSVLRGNGDGTFSSVGDVSMAVLASDLVAADFDDDGRIDLASIRATSPDAPAPSDVAVLLNTNCLARRLAVTRNPPLCSPPNAPFEIQPVVKLYDDGDNVVTCVGGTVQASIVPGSGTPGATLGGTTAVPLVSGVASFGDLSVNAAGDGYVLQFSRAGVISARSRLFRVDTACKGPFAFFTITPCRVLDTRDPAGPWGAPALAGNSSRRFAIAGKCAVPADARSVAANLIVVLPSEGGYLTLFPAGRTAPLASAINFRPGVVRANNAVLALGDAGDIEAFCGMPPGSNVDFVLDVVGYFR